MSEGKVISFINMKGGVGKTTLCREIGYTLNKRFNKSILFVDIDPQANLTQSLLDKYNYLPQSGSMISNAMQNSKKYKQSISHLFTPSAIVRPKKDDVILNLDESPKLSLIPGDLNTVFLERTSSSDSERALDNFLARNKICDEYDFILVDCPPTYSFYTTAAFLASDYYLIPVGIDPYSVLGIDLLEQVVEQIKDSNPRVYQHRSLKNIGIIFNPMGYENIIKNNLDNQKKHIKNAKSLQKYNLFYFETIFNYNKRYGKQLSYYAIDTQSTNHIANIEEITHEFLDRINNMQKKS